MNNWLVWLLSFILPRRKWYRNYYLRSRHWQKTSLDAIWNAHWVCQKCGGRATARKNGGRKMAVDSFYLDTHHLRYYRNGKSILWHERPEDLQVLCRTCHNKEHERN